MADISALKAAGMDIDGMSPAEQEALQRLDSSEIDSLVKIREKLNAEPEVSGHALPREANGNLVW
jgi:hypothetical protein